MGSLTFVRQPAKKKENSKFKPAALINKLTLCHILHSEEEWGKYILINEILYLAN